MRKPLILVMFLTVAAPLWSAREARAACPEHGLPNDSVCKHYDAFLMPGLIGVVFVPGNAKGPWFGGGAQFTLYTWSHNTNKFGPGQGKFVFDVALLGSGESDTQKMAMFRGGVNLSFERNSSRSFAIPFFGLYMGGLTEGDEEMDANAVGGHGFIEGSLGVHALYMRNVIIDLEGGYVFPYDDIDRIAGFKGSLSLAFSMW